MYVRYAPAGSEEEEGGRQHGPSKWIGQRVAGRSAGSLGQRWPDETETTHRDERTRVCGWDTDGARRAVDEHATFDEWADTARSDHFELAPRVSRPSIPDTVVHPISATGTPARELPHRCRRATCHADNSP
jgi:hypothetical protein